MAIGVTGQELMKATKFDGLITILITALLGLNLVAGGFIWSGSFPVQFGTFAVSLVLATGYLVWRLFIDKKTMPRTGLEIFFALALVAMGLSLVFSPSPSMGFWRVGRLTTCCVLFYIALDLFGEQIGRGATLKALLWISGVALALAVMETYQAYQGYWKAAGGITLPPTTYRFVSVLGHANALMGLVNLCAPIALILFIQLHGKRASLIAYATWLVLYVIAVPFSSSRGGWLGQAVWAGVLAVFWLHEAKPWKRLQTFSALRKWLVPVVGAIVVSLILFGGYKFVRYFSVNPSHGDLSNIFSGRSDLWSSALTIWRLSPLVGAGAGRFGMEYLAVNNRVPPQYWASHSHSIIFETLAEFGLVGAIAGLALLVALVIFVYRCYRAVRQEQRWLARAVVAALAAWLVQNVVDDFTFWMAIMVPLVLLLAWLGTASREPLPRQKHLSAAWIGLLALAPAALVAWSIWTYVPMAQGLQSAAGGNWHIAATQIQASAQRDPSLAFYKFEASLAWAQAWAQDGNEDELRQAIQDLQDVTAMEPAFSLAWEDMGVEENDDGQAYLAIIDLRHAEALAPDEPSYPLNLAIIYETQQRDDLARVQYQQVLTLAPQWSGYPSFWRQTALRADVIHNWMMTTAYFKNHVPADWELAQASSDRAKTRQLAADSQWLGETSFAGNAILGMTLAAEGNPSAQSYDEAAAAGINLQTLHSANEAALTYSLWINDRQGLPIDLVPGYAQLDITLYAGQFDFLQQLYQMQVKEGGCAAAEQTWYKLQSLFFPGQIKLAASDQTCTPSMD